MIGTLSARLLDVETRTTQSHLRAVLGYQLRHREQGLCMLCPRVAVSANYCERHRRKINSRRRAGSTQWRCQVCLKPGHNRRTCPQARAHAH
jgi:5-methylcytosine-specific restriction endonuclease McrA